MIVLGCGLLIAEYVVGDDLQRSIDWREQPGPSIDYSMDDSVDGQKWRILKKYNLLVPGKFEVISGTTPEDWVAANAELELLNSQARQSNDQVM